MNHCDDDPNEKEFIGLPSLSEAALEGLTKATHYHQYQDSNFIGKYGNSSYDISIRSNVSVYHYRKMTKERRQQWSRCDVFFVRPNHVELMQAVRIAIIAGLTDINWNIDDADGNPVHVIDVLI